MDCKTVCFTTCPFSYLSVIGYTRIFVVIICILLSQTVWAPMSSLSASTLPAGFTESLIVSGLNSPTAMAMTPDGRIFICEQGGQLRVVKNAELLPTPFLSLNVNSNGERGLLGVAIDPDFATNQFVYVYYTTATNPIHNRISRFTANGDTVAPGSEVALLEIDPPPTTSAVTHNAGALHFGPDGKLYIAVGDHNRSESSQEFTTLQGKLLRLNPDGTIPTDNPFYNSTSGVYRAIWALGLRNPFTFGIQPGTGRIFINDVGGADYEEINDGLAGSNYGWPTCEGVCNPPNTNFQDPIYTYGHIGDNCAITGGTFYNPSTVRFPSAYVGKYFFADLCAGWIKSFDPTTNTVSDFATTSNPSYIVDLDVSANGELYYLQRGGNGQLYRIAYLANQAPSITQHPVSVTVTAGQSATFSVAATGTNPLSYQWQRDGVNIANATAATYMTASTVLADNGALFRCVVSNSFGTATSNEATLTVVTDQPPTASITTPVAGAIYQAGQTINYDGTGTDPETGNLPPSAFTWQVDFHHDNHTHPHVPPTFGVTNGSFEIPNIGETATNVWYRIHLTVMDPFGLSHSVYRDILPRLSTLTLQTNPTGLQVTLDLSPLTTPNSGPSVAGMNRTLGVVSPQAAGATNYVFSAWSDGGAATHSIVTPTTNTTYTATYVACSYTISPTSRTISSAGGTGTVSVTAAGGCPWMATSNAAWILITGGSNGSGNGSVSYSVAANTDAQRTGTITIANKTFTLTQSTGCSYSISPTNQSFPVSGGTGTVNVTAGSGCTWTAKSNNSSWITITAGKSGTGNGTVTYSVKARTGSTRTGSITIAGKTFTVNQ